MPLFTKRPRAPAELRRAFEDGCRSIATTRRRYQKAAETAPDAELYRIHNQLSNDLAPIYFHIDGILDEYLESRHGKHAARSKPLQ